MEEAALFFADYLEETEDGQLVTNPSVSPENTYILPNGETGQLCIGAAMDSQILHELFTACLEAYRIIGSEHELRGTFQHIWRACLAGDRQVRADPRMAGGL